MTSRHEDLRKLADNASKMSLHEFAQLVDNVVELLSKENGLVGNLKIAGRLIETPPEGEATVVGDLHGDLESLTQILKSSNFFFKVQGGKKSLLVFLGDYRDR